MKIHESMHGAVKVIRPEGPLSLADADEVRDLLLEVRKKSLGRLVLDASAVPFIDSAGLEALLNVNEALATGGQALKLSGLSDLLREVLELTEIAASFDLYEDVQSAVRSFL
jgi:anti-sigma B factor antagonist